MPSKIICCYAKLHVATQITVSAYAPGAEFIDTSGSPFDYWRAIKRNWTGERDLIIIEQDIEIAPEVIPEFEKCYEHWCVYDYEMACPRGWLRESLGCTKFSAEMQAAVPADLICKGDHPWDGLDITMGIAFKKYGGDVINPYAKRQGGLITSHVHGSLKHHHAYPMNPLGIRNGVIPGGTLHEREKCEFCGGTEIPGTRVCETQLSPDIGARR